MLYSVVDVVDVVVVVVVVVQHALHLKCTFTVVTQDALKAGLFLPSPVPVTSSCTYSFSGSGPR